MTMRILSFGTKRIRRMKNVNLFLPTQGPSRPAHLALRCSLTQPVPLPIQHALSPSHSRTHSDTRTHSRAHSNFTHRTRTRPDDRKVQAESTRRKEHFSKLPRANTYSQDPWRSHSKNTSHSGVRGTQSWHKTGMMFALEIQLLLWSRENTNKPKEKNRKGWQDLLEAGASEFRVCVWRGPSRAGHLTARRAPDAWGGGVWVCQGKLTPPYKVETRKEH